MICIWPFYFGFQAKGWHCSLARCWWYGKDEKSRLEVRVHICTEHLSSPQGPREQSNDSAAGTIKSIHFITEHHFPFVTFIFSIIFCTSLLINLWTIHKFRIWYLFLFISDCTPCSFKSLSFLLMLKPIAFFWQNTSFTK